MQTANVMMFKVTLQTTSELSLQTCQLQSTCL